MLDKLAGAQMQVKLVDPLVQNRIRSRLLERAKDEKLLSFIYYRNKIK